jgi:hypothetical protein
MLHRIVAVASLLCASCVTQQAAMAHTTSQGKFSPQERDRVWNRALDAYQTRGILIAASDRAGGVLRSDSMSAQIPCSTGQCAATSVYQLTLSDDGSAFLRVNRGAAVFSTPATGGATSYDRAKLQWDADDLLAAILGTAPPPAPSQPAAMSPASPEPAPFLRPGKGDRAEGVPCGNDSQCKPGLVCYMNRCQP